MKPSSLRTYVYCPRLYFFESHVRRERGLLERLRLALGRLYHVLAGIVDMARGRVVEEPLEARLGDYVFVGRPDAWRVEEGRLVVTERKSGRGPRRGVWLSDAAQAAAYAFMLLRSRVRGANEATLEVGYAFGGVRRLRLTEDLVDIVLRAAGEMRMVREGVVPYAYRVEAKCSICPYRVPCEELDRSLAPPEEGEIYEPGSWLASREPALDSR